MGSQARSGQKHGTDCTNQFPVHTRIVRMDDVAANNLKDTVVWAISEPVRSGVRFHPNPLRRFVFPWRRIYCRPVLVEHRGLEYSVG